MMNTFVEVAVSLSLKARPESRGVRKVAKYCGLMLLTTAAGSRPG
jgi:hypothetical protein